MRTNDEDIAAYIDLVENAAKELTTV